MLCCGGAAFWRGYLYQLYGAEQRAGAIYWRHAVDAGVLFAFSDYWPVRRYYLLITAELTYDRIRWRMSCSLAVWRGAVGFAA